MYWSKAIDKRLCAAAPGAELEPWLIQPPSAWTQAWPCSGSQFSKMAYVATFPGPFMHSLVWPIVLSELHLTTTFFLFIVAGLLMVVTTPTHEYTTDNRRRIAWATITKLHIKAVPIVIRLLRPSTPWPVVVSDNIHTEGAGSLFLAMGLPLPAPVQVVVALVDFAEIALICAMHGDSWTHEVPRRALLLRQLAAGAAAVFVSVVLHGGWGLGGGPRRSARPLLKGCKTDKGACGSGVTDSQHSCAESADEGAGCDKQEVAAQPPSSQAAPASSAPATAARTPEPAPAPSRDATAATATTTAVATDAAVHAAAAARRSQLLGLCRSLLTPDVGSVGGCSYRSPLAVTQVRLKLPDVEPWDLPPGLQGRVTAALSAYDPGVTAMDITVRSGCVELHLDLLRSLEAAAAAGLLGAEAGSGLAPPQEDLAPVPEQQRALAASILQAMGLPPGYNATVRAQIGTHLLTLAPAAAPAGGANSGGGDGAAGWAVLGTRRMQAHELPWVACVDPPAVTPAHVSGSHAANANGLVCGDGSAQDADACAAADGIDAPDMVLVPLRLRVCGPADELARAQDDTALELLAMFDGTFLPVAGARWEPSLSPAYTAPVTGAAAKGLAAAGSPALPLGGPGHRMLEARVALPSGRSGAVRLVLSRRGTAGRGVSLLLLRPDEAALAGEVVDLQRRAQAATATAVASAMWVGGGGVTGPSASSVQRFVEDLGRWLQYRDYWLEEAEKAAGAAAAAAKARSTVSEATGWHGAIAKRMAGVFRNAGEAVAAALLYRLRPGIRSGRVDRQPELAPQQSPNPSEKRSACSSSAELSCVAAHLQLLSGPDGEKRDVQRGGGSSGCAACSVRSSAIPDAPGHAMPRDLRAAWPAGPQAQQPEPHLPLPRAQSLEERQQFPAALLSFRREQFQQAMRTARRALVEFALEQRCPAIAATLLTAYPLPSAPAVSALPPGGGAAAGMECQLAQLAEASRAASSDGLTLLHRAVRSGDAATVRAVLRATTASPPAVAPQPPTTASTSTAATAAPSRGTGVRRPGPAAPWRLCSWDAADGHGLTPLHYLAVLPDGGQLARAVLRSEPDALALWDAERPGVLSAACFAEQNGLMIDVAALRREVEAQAEARMEAQADAGRVARGGGKGGGSAASAAQGSHEALKTQSAPPAGSAPCEHDCSCHRLARSCSLPVWLLLGHVVACFIGLMQALLQQHARCRFSVLPLALHLGSVLLAVSSSPRRPASTSSTSSAPCTLPHPRRRVAWSGASSGVAWAMQLLALAALVAQTAGLPRDWPLGLVRAAGGPADELAGAVGRISGGGGPGVCGGGGGTLYNGLVVLHYVLAVSTVPYSHTLYKVLAVQAVEVLACLALSWAALHAGDGAVGEGPDRSSGAGADLGWGPGGAVWRCAVGAQSLVRGAVARFARGWVLRVAASTVIILAGDLRPQAASVHHHPGARPKTE